MNREIKFRAWDAAKKVMLESVDLSAPISTWGWLGYYDLPLMQFTALHDKNGREIYEGDIVSYPETESTYVDVGIGGGGVKVAEQDLCSFFPVEYRMAQYGLDVKGDHVETLERGWHALTELYDEFGTENILVIGNIYENPDLLNSKDL